MGALVHPLVRPLVRPIVGPIVGQGGSEPPLAPLALPVSFDVDLYRDETGYFTDWTPATHEAAAYTGSTIYVSTTGNDTTGDGSSGTPYATADKAFTEASDLDIISFAPGVYGMPGALTKDLMLARTGSSGWVIFGSFLDISGATIGSYSGSGVTCDTLSTSDFGGVKPAGFLRTDYVGGHGVIGSMSWHVNTQAALIAQGYPCIYKASTLSYLTQPDGADLADLRTAGTILVWGESATDEFVIDGANVYLGEGLVFAGHGTDMVEIINGSRVVRDRCHFYGSADTNITVVGSEMFSYQSVNCGSINNAISYEQIFGQAVEVECVSVGPVANTSTGHGTGNILRVGGHYGEAQRVIHDIQTGYAFTFSSVIENHISSGQSAIRNSSSTQMIYGDMDISGTYSAGQIVDENTTNPAVVIDLEDAWPYS